MTNSTLALASTERVEEVRRFNRFYTRRIGVLQNGFLQSQYSLVEVRVLSELYRSGGITSAAVCKELQIDPGYLSRMIKKFDSAGLIARTRNDSDARQQILSLTERGVKTFQPLNQRQHQQVAEMIAQLDDARQVRLLAAMSEIEQLLAADAGDTTREKSFVIRHHRPGDMGWVVHRHGVLYCQEYNWNEEFEALVAKIVAEFIDNFDPEVERCWIAEQRGQIAGSIFLVKKSKTAAQLRLFYVEPSVRGQGIGKRLVEECIQFARQVGYRSIILWTQTNLGAARHLYKQAGFIKTSEEPHNSFGKQLVAETWELDLTTQS